MTDEIDDLVEELRAWTRAYSVGCGDARPSSSFLKRAADALQTLKRERDEARENLMIERGMVELHKQAEQRALTRAEKAEAKVKELEAAAHRMVSWIEGGHIPYLIDTDDNPGQALRQALKENQHD